MNYKDQITIPGHGVVSIFPLLHELLDALSSIITYIPTRSDERHTIFEDDHILIVYDTKDTDIIITLLFPNNRVRMNSINGVFTFNYASQTLSCFHPGYKWLYYVLIELYARAKEAEYGPLLMGRRLSIPPSLEEDHRFGNIDDDLFL